MRKHRLTERELENFACWLREEEFAPGSVALYLRDVRQLSAFLGREPLEKSAVIRWKEHLVSAGYAPATVNAKLAAANRFFRFMGWEECRVKALRVQKRVFRSEERELSRDEYRKLIETAERTGQERLSLAAQTLCSCGIRVSELRHITVEAARAGSAEVSMKGKIRKILLPAKLCRRLLRYARGKKIASGEIFLTRSGKSLSRKQLWAELKALCEKAGVSKGKVFPHNLRHLFARVFYQACRDIALLADVLGHSSIETTRIYLISTGTEHARQIDRLGLIS